MNAPTNGADAPPIPKPEKKSKKVKIPKSGLSRFGHWLFGYILPLYFVVGALCFIAAPGLFGLGHSTPKSDTAPTVVAQSQAASTSEFKIADLVRMAMESSKDRFEAIKEGHDKLFSLIAALAALLAFFGFKGIETYNATKSKAEDTVALAEEAVAKADDASELAKKSVKDLEVFVKTRYTKGATAEINLAQGLVLKEIAELFKKLTSGDFAIHSKASDGPTEQQFHNAYHGHLRESLSYFDRVTDNPDGVEPEVTARALIFRATILKKLGRLDEALKSVQLAQKRYPGHEYAAHFNAACYCCLLSSRALDDQNPTAASEHEHSSITYLARSIELDPSLKLHAAQDEDFEHFRKSKNTRYLALIAVSS